MASPGSIFGVNGETIRRRFIPVGLHHTSTATLMTDPESRYYIALSMADMAILWTLGFAAAVPRC